MDRNMYIVKNYHNGKEAVYMTYRECPDSNCLDHTSFQECPVSKCLKRNTVWEPHMHRIFEKYIDSKSIVLETRSYIGEHTIKLAKLCRQLYAFEPVASSSEILRINLFMNELSNVTLFRNRLSDSVSPDPVSKEGIHVMTIDSLELEKVDFLKITFEHAAEVIEGAKETIRKCLPVVIVNIRDFVNIGSPPSPSLEEFQKRFPLLVKSGYQWQPIEDSFEFLFLPPNYDDREYEVVTSSF